MSTKILEHNGFQGSVEFSLENNLLFGKILHINDLVSFEADNVKELQASFIEAIEDYIETCKELNVEPDRPFSGSFNIRIGQTLHRGLARQATREDKSINDVVKDAIDCHINGRHQEIHHHYEPHNAYEADYFMPGSMPKTRVDLRVVQ